MTHDDAQALLRNAEKIIYRPKYIFPNFRNDFLKNNPKTRFDERFETMLKHSNLCWKIYIISIN